MDKPRIQRHRERVGWTFVVVALLVIAAYYLASWASPGLRRYGALPVYLVIAVEIVIAAYLFGVGAVSAEVPEEQAETEVRALAAAVKVAAPSRTRSVRLPAMAPTAPPLGPPIAPRSAEKTGPASDRVESAPGAGRETT
jgi:hypothetical protein